MARRTGEIGIRMAFGAGCSDALWMVMRHAGAGHPGGDCASRRVRAMLFGLEPGDPPGIAAAVLLLAVAAAFAG